MKRLFVLFCLVALSACPKGVPAKDTLPDASSGILDAGTSYGAACANLAAVGCPEGAMPDCAAVLQRMRVARLTSINVACLASALTPVAVQACGGVACVKP
jgi:hypothetical protein